MRDTVKAARHPIEHPVDVLWTLALFSAGQLLLGRALAKAARRAEREDLQPSR